MTSKENIRALSRRVVQAEENSEEFWLALDELRAARKTGSTRGQKKIAEMRQTIPRTELNFPGRRDE